MTEFRCIGCKVKFKSEKAFPKCPFCLQNKNVERVISEIEKKHWWGK